MLSPVVHSHAFFASDTMKKKNKKTSNEATAAGGARPTCFSDGDINSMIRNHSLFFDKLVELIPARFYLPPNEKEKIYFQGLSNAEKAEAKQKAIENTKKARRNRLDPSKSSKTTLDLLRESLEGEKSENDVNKLGVDDVDLGLTVNLAKSETGGESVTYEELQFRLRRKLDALKAGRGGGSKKRDGERREEQDVKKRKQDLEREDDKRKGKMDDDGKEVEDGRDIEEETSEAAKGIEFGKVKLGDDDDNGNDRKRRKKRKMTKEKELEMARKLQEAMKDPEKGELVAQKHSWKAAANRAMGVKVHDNPKLLKESIQREKRKHKKSVDNWKERIKNTEAMKQERQEKRKGNIQAKIHKKKMKKIEKREKKRMNRPGFEGRKDGFINGD